MADAAAGITRIGWTVYGKIDTIEKTGDDIYYTYDASGNRISKRIGNKTTVYVRDAQGNVMSVYEGRVSPKQAEIHLYGSSRLGILGELTTAPQTITLDGDYGTAKLSTFTRGEKLFELSNHLGNVLATVTDKKIQHDDGSGEVEYYTADVGTANDYYPGGMQMPGRIYTSGNGYRYSINGQEITPEIGSNTTTAEFWQYDARIMRRWNLDPKPNVATSSYSTFNNNPVFNIDPKGDTTVPREPLGFANHYKKREELQLSYKSASRIFNITDDAGDRFLIRETKELVNGYGKFKYWKTSRSYWSERPQGESLGGYSSDAHWIPYIDEGDLAIIHSREVSNIILGSLGVSAIAIFAAPVVIDKAPAVLSYLAPKPGFNPTGAAWDFANQKFIQGKSFQQINWSSTITAGAFGGGNVVSNALWGASGSFADLSVQNLSNGGNVFNINRSGLISFTSNTVGNLFSGGTGKIFTSLNSVIINSTERMVVNQVLTNTMEGIGQGLSNVIEQNLDKKR